MYSQDEISVMDSQDENAATPCQGVQNQAASADSHVGSSADPSSSSSGAHSDPLLPVDSYPMPATQVTETQAYSEDSTKRRKIF